LQVLVVGYFKVPHYPKFHNVETSIGAAHHMPLCAARIRRTCCTASTAKWQVLETAQKIRFYMYF
jgi:hypothetical protein